MKTAEEQYYDVCEKYRKHCELNCIDQDDAKFNELLEDSYKAYATAAIKEHLSRAAVEARTKRTPDELGSILVIDRESITNTEIILP